MPDDVVIDGRPDPRDPRPDHEMVGRAPIFRNNNCWKCRSGELPCPRNYRGCEFPHARND